MMAGESTEELIVRIDERVEALLNHTGDLEKRMRRVERWQAGIAGLGLVVGVLIALDLAMRVVMGG